MIDRAHDDRYLDVKAGQVLVFTTGEYDDYEVVSLIRMLKDVDLRQVGRKCDEAWSIVEAGIGYQGRPYTYEDHPGPRELADWLIGLGWAEEVEHRKIHMGSRVTSPMREWKICT